MPNSDTFVSNRPNLEEPEVSRQTLLLGFAYSLAPDGAPGVYNVDIANSIRKEFLKSQHDARPCIGMQWEIYDALEEDPGSSAGLLDAVPHSDVAPPPRFREADILDINGIITSLRESQTPATRALVSKIPDIFTIKNDKTALVSLFNQLLYDRNFYEVFESLIDLHDLHRPDKGMIGLEKRTIPDRRKYPHGLRRFQSQRLNRLIIEAILPESILDRGQYLNTKQVANHIFEQIKKGQRTIKHIVIYAHPEHRWWCRKNLTDSVKENNLRISSLQTYFGDTTLFWDSNTAQVWCRSKENWELYKRS